MAKPLSTDLVKEWQALAEERLAKGIQPDMGAYRAIIELCETILAERPPSPSKFIFPNLLHHASLYLERGKPNG